jgi:imidazolonepropionase-like amidohydrolase
MNKLLISLFTLCLLFAQTAVPAAKQDKAVLLKNGDLYTITNGIQESTDILFENGKITKIGKNLTAPAGAETIDVSGKHVYPGLIASYTQIGLTEIGAVNASNDYNEIGNYTPEVNAAVAYNADSEIIPVVRAHGITHAFVYPSGGTIPGRGSFVQLDAWTNEDATIVKDAGLLLSWPRMSVISAWWMQLTPEKQKEEIIKNLKELHDFFAKAKSYADLKKAKKLDFKDQRMEAMYDYITGAKKVFVSASSFKEIEAAVNLIKKYQLNAVLVDAADALKAVDLIKEANIPIILKMTLSVPNHEDEAYSQFYELPSLLAKNGIPFVLSGAGRGMLGQSWGNSNLAFSAGHAVGFGLSKEKALESITLTAAKVFGVEKELGSLEVGKEATIVVSKGDILDPLTHKVLLEFINGRKVDLDNRHKRLYSKFKQKN